MIFRIRMLWSEDEAFVRDYEVSYAMTLLDFHRFICLDLGYDPMNMASFFSSNERWEQLREFTLMDMGLAGDGDDEAPVPMEGVNLGRVLHRNNDRLIYVFDAFGGRAMFLELTGSFRGPDGVESPRVVESRGTPPEQFDLSATGGGESLFDEAMDDYADFGGDEVYDDEF